MLSTALFDYELPEELIAQHPAARRDGSRMMVLNRKSGECVIRPFSAIVDYLEPGDALIYNDTRVLRGRMYARKNSDPAGAKFELLLVEALDSERRRWNAMLKPGKRALPGVTAGLLDNDGSINSDGDSFCVIGRNGDGTFEIEFSTTDSDRLQQRYGHIPLPPYISRGDENADAERYQTIFAEKEGAVAAPTAGMHFSKHLMKRMEIKGIDKTFVTLHVGLGNFRTVDVEDLSKHKMDSEQFFVEEAAAEAVNAAKRQERKVVAIGTTVMRTIETAVSTNGMIKPMEGWTNKFIFAPYEFTVADAMVTNLHLPYSTQLMMVAAFGGYETVMNAYKVAKEEGYRFGTYGDAMLIL